MNNTIKTTTQNLPLIDKLREDNEITLHIDTIKGKVGRDIENLLNTRRSQIMWPKEWHELESSLLAYGVPDITGKILDNHEVKKQFCESLLSAIQHFEPRLQNITINIVDNQKPSSQILNLRIEAILLLESQQEPVIFNSILKQELGTFFIENSEYHNGR